jgi:hypothetical protein
MSRNPFLNNRFNNLDFEPDNNKKNKKQQHYESSKNSFISKNIDPKKTASDEFIVTDELFPTLTPIVPTEQDITNFKDALTSVNTEAIQENKITNGWIEVYKVNNKIVYNNALYEPKSRTTDSNIMNKFVSIMQYKYDKYKTNYDSVYGDGAYDETFLTNTYESDYDTDEEDYESSTEYEDEYEEIVDDNF